MLDHQPECVPAKCYCHNRVDLRTLVLNHLQGRDFANTLAEIIGQNYGEQILSEFNNEFTSQMEEIVKKLVSKYIESYLIVNNIEGRVKKALEGITKQELLEIIAK